MTVRQDKDLLSKIQSSYLWTSDNEQPNDVTVSTIKVDYFSRYNLIILGYTNKEF
jgi:hypothetical protein